MVNAPATVGIIMASTRIITIMVEISFFFLLSIFIFTSFADFKNLMKFCHIER